MDSVLKTQNRMVKEINSVNESNGKLYLKTFLLSILLSFLIFIPFVIYDKGYFLFYGDFNVQQIPFYKLAHDAVKNGNLFWNWHTDLGVNFVSSYSFYLLGSPFFYLTLPFPNEVAPYLMAPLFCIKFATAATTATAYMTRFTKDKSLAMLGGILYSFSGFQIYNIFFNHFHDAVAFFPLLLIGVEDFMKKEKRGIFAFAVFLCASINYFFFVGQVTFLVIYVLVRIYTGDFKMTVKKFISLAIESLLGFLMSLWILLPAVLGILSNPRVTDFPHGWNAVTYPNVQRYLQIFGAFFFPAELPSSPNFYPNAEAKWSSVAGWLPFVGMSGVIAVLRSKEKNFTKNIIKICVLFAFIPILNSAFYAFNSSYYARWFYMPILIMSLMTIMSFENENIVLGDGIKPAAIISMSFIVVIGLMPKIEDGSVAMGLSNDPVRFWLSALIVIMCFSVFILLYKLYFRSKRFNKAVLIATSIIIVFSSIVFLTTGKYSRNKYDEMHLSLNGWDNWNLPEREDIKDQFYRVDVADGMDNQAMFWHLPTIQTFHSVVPGSIMEFYPSVGVKRDVGSRAEQKNHGGLRNFLSVKFLMIKDEGTEVYPEMSGYEYIDTQYGFKLYENTNYIKMGTTYDYYISESQFSSMPEESRENAMIGAIYLLEESEKKYSHLFKPAVYTDLTSLKEDSLSKLSEIRNSNSAYYFKYDNQGFTSKIDSNKETLMFFTVPYENGWSATVNNVPVNIEKANVGFMAVPIEEGENTIRFTYETPGLKIGIVIGGIAIVLFVFYLSIATKFLKSKTEKVEKVNEDVEHNEEIDQLSLFDKTNNLGSEK